MEYSERKGNLEETGWRITEADDVYLKLENYKPLAYFFQTFVKGSLNWSSLCPGIKTTLFCPIQPELKDGLIIDIRGHMYGVAVLWPYDDFSVLSSALRSDAIIDRQSRPKIFFGISRTLYEPLEETVRGIGLNIELTYELQTYFMDPERARNLTIDEPEGVTLKKLNISHASKVNSTWQGARQQSLKFIEDMISINHSVGLFTETGSEPIAWILESFYGLGSLFTVTEHRLKGYGAICVTALAKILGEEGKNVTAMVREHNLSAQKLFKKLGFHPSGILKGHFYVVVVFWPYDDFSVLSSALRSDAIIDWQRRPRMTFGISEALYLPLEESVLNMGATIEQNYEIQAYFMDPESARNLTIEKQDGVVVKKLTLSHASMINSTWPGARRHSLKFIEDMISINHSVGLFTENGSEPISWAVECMYGLGSLFTVMECRSKGYGAISVTALAKILGEEGKNVTAMVTVQNLSAQKVFKKLGFQPIGILKVIQTLENP